MELKGRLRKASRRADFRQVSNCPMNHESVDAKKKSYLSTTTSTDNITKDNIALDFKHTSSPFPRLCDF